MTGRIAGVRERVTRGRRTQRCRPGLEPMEPRVVLSTYMVTNTSNDGPGSLRQAILDADGHSGADVIDFSIGGGGQQTIALTQSLPEITDSVTIDGSSQPGFNGKPLIVLDGSAIHTGGSGLVLSGGRSTIKGLVIDHFGRGAGGSGIWIKGGGGNTILGNYIGVDPTGNAPAGNTYAGIWVTDSSSNTIGDGTEAGRNVISGNLLYGVRIEGQQTGATLNDVVGNLIGTNAAGTQALGNGLDGVSLWRASDNSIGQAVLAEPGSIESIAAGIHVTGDVMNVISGNGRDGVSIGSDGVMAASRNRVNQSLIGTAVDGTHALANGRNGVYLFNANNNMVGFGDVISGNGANGVEITGPLAVGNQVAGNMIGMSLSGTDAVGNHGDGVLIESASYNAVGPALVGFRAGNNSTSFINVITANRGNGVTIEGRPGHNNSVLANLIGTDKTGLVGFGNQGNGIAVIDSSNNFIGWGFQVMSFPVGGVRPVANVGTSPPTFYASNIISANTLNGILISGLGATGNRFGDDVIGEDSTGAALGNDRDGVLITQGASRNVFTSNLLPNGSIVAYNQGGIEIQSGDRNTIDQTSSFLNGGLDAPGIQLDNGANDNAPAPVITQAYLTPGGQTIATGFLNARPNTTYMIELYFKVTIVSPVLPNHTADQRLADSIQVHTDALGHANLEFKFVAPVLHPGGLLSPPPGPPSPPQDFFGSHWTVSATATDPNGNTSAFSNNEPVANVQSVPGALQISMVESPQPAYVGENLVYTITVLNGGPTALTNVRASVPVPVGTRFFSLFVSQGAGFNADPSNIRLGTLLAHGQATIKLTVHPLIPDSTVTAIAGAVADQPDPDLTDNVAVLRTFVGNTPGVVGLIAPNFVFAETSGKATITLIRTDGTLGSVAVPYTISDGTAHLGVDYGGPTTGTVVFQPGQTVATITIPIIDRHLTDSASRTLVITLGKPSSGWLSAQTAATIAIVDTPPTPTGSRPLVAASFQGRR